MAFPAGRRPMNDADRFKLLHGPYRSPRCRIGGKLFCEVRGWVKVRRMSNGPIVWPMTIRKDGGRPFLIICGGLVRAIQRESSQSICHWWGVTGQTVTVWRKALGVEQFNEGTRAYTATGPRSAFLPRCRSGHDDSPAVPRPTRRKRRGDVAGRSAKKCWRPWRKGGNEPIRQRPDASNRKRARDLGFARQRPAQRGRRRRTPCSACCPTARW